MMISIKSKHVSVYLKTVAYVLSHLSFTMYTFWLENDWKHIFLFKQSNVKKWIYIKIVL